MTQRKQLCPLILAVAVLAVGAGIRDADSAPPDVVYANMDYDASGYVTPAGMMPPHLYQGGVMPVGYYDAGCGCASHCDSGCDSGGNCGASGGCGCSSGACSMLGSGGLLGKLSCGTDACGGCGNSGCPSCGGLTNFRHLCLFCQGDGCSVCQSLGRGHLLGALSCLKPYGEAGLCSQRWYDLSAEVLFLGHDTANSGFGVTSLGTGPTGPIVLRVGEANSGEDLEAGVRLSAAMIWGPGGNLEATYIGGNEWDNRAAVTDPNGQLFSYITNFGQGPPLDDVDNSMIQSLDSASDFNSGELNYRRRTVGPYCRFQGSWLVGLRYIRYQDQLIYAAANDVQGSFFSSNDKARNSLFGPQIGGDLWWNIHPGISLGVGAKGAWMKNDIDRRAVVAGNSLNAGFPGSFSLQDGKDDSTVMGEFEAKLVYRLTHSFSFRTAYYAVALDEVVFGGVDAATIQAIGQGQTPDRSFQFDSIVIQGVSFGTEYIW